jgi:SAM-dependent methyltransferase
MGVNGLSKETYEDYLKRQDKKPVYDLWLDKHADVLRVSRHRPILDLGCGLGNDSLYLTERGFQVISCDKSEAAVTAAKKHVPDAHCKVFDMLDGLPFEDDSFSVVIADLCLHYFSWNDTLRIVRDIRRILTSGGVLLCRVNSVNDVNYGAGQGEVIEENYYNVSGNAKRFFDRDQLNALFSGWQLRHVREERLDRFGQPKILWEVAARKSSMPEEE